MKVFIYLLCPLKSMLDHKGLLPGLFITKSEAFSSYSFTVNS